MVILARIAKRLDLPERDAPKLYMEASKEQYEAWQLEAGRPGTGHEIRTYHPSGGEVGRSRLMKAGSVFGSVIFGGRTTAPYSPGGC